MLSQQHQSNQYKFCCQSRKKLPCSHVWYLINSVLWRILLSWFDQNSSEGWKCSSVTDSLQTSPQTNPQQLQPSAFIWVFLVIFHPRSTLSLPCCAWSWIWLHVSFSTWAAPGCIWFTLQATRERMLHTSNRITEHLFEPGWAGKPSLSGNFFLFIPNNLAFSLACSCTSWPLIKILFTYLHNKMYKAPRNCKVFFCLGSQKHVMSLSEERRNHGGFWQGAFASLVWKLGPFASFPRFCISHWCVCES